MEPTLPDLLSDIRNLSFFFIGFTVIWVFVLSFAFTVSRREKNLRAEIEELKDAADASTPK